MNLVKVLLVTILITLLPAKKAQALDTRAKVVLSVAGYGAAGGALLGIASLAFGTKARAIAQGASLGLYAGLIFGAYIVVSHHYNQANPSGDLYPESGGLYNQFGPDDGYQAQLRDDLDMQRQRVRTRNVYQNSFSNTPDWSMNFLNLSF